jgi:23S rRNA pseudouridine1911/1915/1917 synthase
MTENRFCLTEEYEGERIDKVLVRLLEDTSRNYLKKLFADGSVQLNGKAVKPSARVKEGDEVWIAIPDRVVPDILAEDIPLEVLYEDEDVLVVNKPKDMVVHPAAGHYSGTLVNAVMYRCRDQLSGINGVLRPGIVHRIDKDTTGSIIVCKNDASHNSIAAQLKDHTIVRKYYAIVYGCLKEDEMVIDRPIGRDPKDRKKMAVRPDGKRAVTHVRVLERFRNYTYVECRLETGRTHQIRVHMAFAGHPLLGDTVYQGSRKCPFQTRGQCLHAGILGFVHPRTGAYIETSAPLPDYFTAILDTLRSREGNGG